MLATYRLAFLFGKFFGGLLCGLIPFIIFAVKKRWGLAFLALLVCGFAAFFHSIASIVAGVAFLFVAFFTESMRY